MKARWVHEENTYDTEDELIYPCLGEHLRVYLAEEVDKDTASRASCTPAERELIEAWYEWNMASTGTRERWDKARDAVLAERSRK